MSDALALVPVEQSLVAYLEVVTPWSVSTRVPEQKPVRFVVVSRSGGSPANMAQAQPVVRVECWGSTADDAWAVAEMVWPIVLNLPRLPGATVPGMRVQEVESTEPVNYPDTSTTFARYQFMATITATAKE